MGGGMGFVYKMLTCLHSNIDKSVLKKTLLIFRKARLFSLIFLFGFILFSVKII